MILFLYLKKLQMWKTDEISESRLLCGRNITVHRTSRMVKENILAVLLYAQTIENPADTIEEF
jgi:hypothetical protein